MPRLPAPPRTPPSPALGRRLLALASLGALLAAVAAGCAGKDTALAPADVAGASAAPLDTATADAGAAPGDDAASTADAAAARGPRPVPPPTFAPAAPRVVAIGDLHGDIVITRKLLKLAGAIDDNDTWIGGKLVVVQVGDQLDRGDGEKAILLLLDDLAEQAHKAGGAVYALNGNHETINVELYFKYVTPGGWVDFSDVPHWPDDALLQSYPVARRGRVSAFRPGGPYAGLLAGHNTIQVVGDTVFVHGGVLPKHVSYGVEKINHEISQWMLGKAKEPDSVSGDDCPVWSRHYSKDVDAADCKLAADTLAGLGAKRIVVAHTVQSQGINSVCQGTVWRVDVGNAAYYGGAPQVLVIEGDKVTVLK